MSNDELSPAADHSCCLALVEFFLWPLPGVAQIKLIRINIYLPECSIFCHFGIVIIILK
jgi:hypothetical protein